MGRGPVGRVVGHLGQRRGHPPLPHDPAVQFRRAGHQVGGDLVDRALVHPRHRLLDEPPHRRRHPDHRRHRHPAEAPLAAAGVGQHHADVAVQEPAGAVQQVLAPGGGVVPPVADLAHEPDHGRDVVERQVGGHEFHSLSGR